MANIRKVISAVSGGIDSAVSTLLLRNKGYEVIGVFMQNWDVLEEKGACISETELEDAQWICRTLGVSFHVANFVKDYWLDVFSNLIEDYESGFTPNPDILCNRQIKFAAFYKYAMDKLGGDAISTGHYARTTFGDYLENQDPKIGVRLLKAFDEDKDQTFFLSQIPQNALQRCIFPIGCLKKSGVRKIAQETSLKPILKKKESMGICFIGSRKFQQFISEYVCARPGCFIDIETEKVVGEHDGIHQWTIGQRCRIGGCLEPYYVVEKCASTQNIYVATGNRHPALFTDLLITDKPYWIHTAPVSLSKYGIASCDFRFQHTHPLLKCQICVTESGKLVMQLEKPVRAISPGQYAVLYLKEECLGSARILSPGPSSFSLGTWKVNEALY